MKTINLFKSIVLLATITLVGCNREEDNNNSNPLSAEDVKISAKIDNIAGDITLIAEDQMAQQSTAKMSPQSILPSCASVTTVITGGTWTSTVDFGTTGCQFTNGQGAILKGKIIVSGSTDFLQSPYVWTYSFENFYYDDILVEGTKTLSRTMETSTEYPIPHPVVVTNLDLDLTYPNGNTYQRTGSRIWNHIEGYGTPLVWNDNIFLTTGSWTTTGPNSSYISTITSPLRFEISCNYRLVSGTIKVEGINHYAILDYGTGTCDNNATISIDGGIQYPFSF